MGQPKTLQFPTLSKGSKGHDVTTIQYLLRCTRDDWHHLQADGIFGPKTEDTVRAYQKLVAIKVDGIVGSHTWGKLTENHRPASTVRRGSTGECVKGAQIQLVKHHLLTSGQVDGKFGPKTEEAVKHFQRKAQMPQNGVVDQETWRHLVSTHGA